MNMQPRKPAMKGPGEIRRKALSTADTLVKMSLLEERANGTTLPLLIQPAFGEVGLIDWARTHREEINTLLSQHGGILFRNFALQTVAEFEQFLQAITDKVLDYQQRSSPRTRIQGNVYTSTDYPADQEIFLHNENSYQRSWPLKIAFFCLIPALQGGETTIADCRRVLSHLDPAIVQRFLEKQVMYVRNYNTGFGLPWQTSFQTTERTVVEAYCRKTGIEFSWVNDDQLQTRQVLPALSRHPRTRELVWFNHATFFHVLTLEPAIREALLAEFPEKDLPNNSYYGDGSAIEPEVIASLQQAYRQEIIRFPWQKGDVLLLDNMLTAHGRAPFIGERKVVVSMAEPWSNDEI